MWRVVDGGLGDGARPSLPRVAGSVDKGHFILLVTLGFSQSPLCSAAFPLKPAELHTSWLAVSLTE